MSSPESTTGDVMSHTEAVAEKLAKLTSSAAYVGQRRQMLGMLTIPEQPISACDIGCGEGSFSRDLSSASASGSRIKGIDTSPFVLGIARDLSKEHPDIEYLQADAGELPFPDSHFDIIAFANTLKYLKTEERQLATLQEHVRVLRPGGQLLVVDGNDGKISYRGGDAELNSRVVSAYANLQGDPASGSRIASLCGAVGLQNLRHGIIPMAEAEFTSEHAGYAMAYNMRDVLTEYAQDPGHDVTVSSTELDAFCDQLGVAAASNEYQWNYSKHATVGIKV